MRSKKVFLLVLTLLLVMTSFVLVSCSSGEAKPSSTENKANEPATSTPDKVYTFKIAHSSSANGDRLPDAIIEISKKIEEESGGRIKLEHYPASQLGGEREILEGIYLGSIDMGVISTGPIAGFFPDIAVTAMPYLLSDREIAWKVYDGKFGQDLAKKMEEETGIRVFGWAENGLRTFSNTKKPVHTPADMKGLIIRTMENETHMSMVNEIGASAVAIPFNELYTALQQGTVDGQENGIALTYAMGFHEVLKYITLDNHVYDPYGVFMNQDVWNSLPADIQEIMNKAMKEFIDLERQYNGRDMEKYTQAMKDKGIEFIELTAEEHQQFVDKTQKTVELIRGKVGDQLVDEFIAAVKEAEGK
jgi:C4-dicarboxylate-binding protein DctP